MRGRPPDARLPGPPADPRPPDHLGHLGAVVRHHPAPARRLHHLVHRADVRHRAASSPSRKQTPSAQEYGLDRPVWFQYLRWMKHGDAGPVRHGAGVEAPRLGGHRRPALAHHGGLGGGHPVDLGAGPADRHLLGRAPVLGRRLRLHPASASSGWPCRASCWPSSSCTSASRSSTSTSAASSRTSSPRRPGASAKAWDLAKHLPLPALILGLAGTAQLIRIMRANLLDELRQALRRHRPRPRAVGARGSS